MRRVLILLLASAAVSVAHHSQADYDETKTVTIEGSVSRFEWANPHVLVFVETPQGTWEVEFPSRAELRMFGQYIRREPSDGTTLKIAPPQPGGWGPEAIHIGDQVSILASPARDGSREALGSLATLPSGIGLSGVLRVPIGFLGLRPSGVPSGTDGHPLLAAPAGQTGYWRALATVFAEMPAGGTPIRMSPDGMLLNLADAAKVAPLQPWALALYQYRQANKLKDDPMAACLPPGGPRQFQDRLGVQFLVQPDRERIMVLSNGANRNWRMIPMDGRALPTSEDVTPTYYGYSVGRWEGDVLVVESTGYIERFWFANGGLPHTESLRLTERFRRRNAATLDYEVTVDDLGAYTRPWTAQLQLEWIDNELQDEYFCDDYNRETLP